ncbi:hypothetical protein CEXT_503641 [Caerostris extrusa]|uniref:Uncharacterized protein n=1 Tax=Caerostris extrusa TaxID=172846 RepID=A0AAV4PGJ0_CAEEX|nr:hypothetical protein CEXT_503641 [Caerostris extrusa]
MVNEIVWLDEYTPCHIWSQTKFTCKPSPLTSKGVALAAKAASLIIRLTSNRTNPIDPRSPGTYWWPSICTLTEDQHHNITYILRKPTADKYSSRDNLMEEELNNDNLPAYLIISIETVTVTVKITLASSLITCQQVSQVTFV